MQTPYISSTILSEELNIPASTIRAYRNRNGVKTRSKLCYVLPEEFIRKYNELQSQEKMAKHYNVDHHVINNFCKNIGFDDSIYKRKKLTEDQIKYAIDNYDKKSSVELSKELNVTDSAIKGVWNRNKLTGKTNRVYYILNENYFENIDSQDKAYFLGFIGADGCLFKPRECYTKQNILRISIHKQDVRILNLLKEYLQTNKPIAYDGNYAALEISSNKIIGDLEKLGLSVRKTYDNTIASVHKDFMPALIRGYFDGDGSIGYDKNILNSGVSIVGYHSNMNKIRQYLESRNIYTSIIYDKRKYNTANDEGRFCSLVFQNKTCKYSFLKLIYEDSDNVFLERKYDRSKEYIQAIESSEHTRDKQIVKYYNYAVQKVC